VTALRTLGAAVLALALTGGASAEPAPPRAVACDACHGAGGSTATPLVPSLAGQPALFLENQLVLVREGLRDIPVMRDLMKDMGDDEIRALARHYAAQPTRPLPHAGAPDPKRLQAGAALAQRALCGTCHLPTYAGQQQVPRLAGQDENYLLMAMRQLRDNPGPGRDTLMSAALYGLGNTELAQLAHFLAHFKP
jgi:cytochrome c553